MSLEFYNFSQNIQDLINQNKTNCIFIAAAGNKGKLNRIKDCYPASYENCISVGAVDENNKRYYRSNMSNHINVAAPGTNINSCISKNIYSNESDTSFAVPFVTGLAALLTSYQIKNNQLNLTIIKDAIINTTTNLGNKTEYGSGLINPSESFNYLKSHL
jgi:subtilisin family serine protease